MLGFDYNLLVFVFVGVFFCLYKLVWLDMIFNCLIIILFDLFFFCLLLFVRFWGLFVFVLVLVFGGNLLYCNCELVWLCCLVWEDDFEVCVFLFVLGGCYFWVVGEEEFVCELFVVIYCLLFLVVFVGWLVVLCCWVVGDLEFCVCWVLF